MAERRLLRLNGPLRDFLRDPDALTGRSYGPSLARMTSIGPPARLSLGLGITQHFEAKPTPDHLPERCSPTTVPTFGDTVHVFTQRKHVDHTPCRRLVGYGGWGIFFLRI